MTAAPWDAGPCDFPDGDQLELDIAPIDAALDLNDERDEPDMALLEHGRSAARLQIPHHRPINDVLETL